MAGELIYAFRVMRLPLLDAGGSTIGRLEDIVLIPGAGGTVSVTSRIGRQRTAALALCGREIDATTALAWGLVDRIT